MIFKKMVIFLKRLLIIFLLIFYTSNLSASPKEFSKWLDNFKILAKKKGISSLTINNYLNNVQYLDKVIGYDNKQPEFFEKTNVYISKRSSIKSLKIAQQKYKKYSHIFNKVEKEFNVEKELLLALWSVETNFGNYLGKMDILSSLATLSFDKRRSEYFTNELLVLLSLADKKIVSKEMLYGSWAGALGNFQFMPSTILNYGIDYDGDKKIDLKNSLPDSIASAANYINKAGWKYKNTCFKEVIFSKNVDKLYFNHSARNIKEKNTSNFWNKKGVLNKFNKEKIDQDGISALVLPDGDIFSPKYLVFSNYETILKWNRSLRFGLSVCTLSKMIKDEI